MTNHPEPFFQIGQQVRVIGANHSQRVGWVRSVQWHFKDGCFHYYLEESGTNVERRKIPTRYLEAELEQLG